MSTMEGGRENGNRKVRKCNCRNCIKKSKLPGKIRDLIKIRHRRKEMPFKERKKKRKETLATTRRSLNLFFFAETTAVVKRTRQRSIQSKAKSLQKSAQRPLLHFQFIFQSFDKDRQSQLLRQEGYRVTPFPLRLCQNWQGWQTQPREKGRVALQRLCSQCSESVARGRGFFSFWLRVHGRKAAIVGPKLLKFKVQSDIVQSSTQSLGPRRSHASTSIQSDDFKVQPEVRCGPVATCTHTQFFLRHLCHCFGHF